MHKDIVYYISQNRFWGAENSTEYEKFAYWVLNYYYYYYYYYF
jgi:hypothetical protein